VIQDRAESYIHRYCDEIRELLGDRLTSIYLYGSAARDEAREESDIDLAFVIRGDFSRGSLIELTSELTSRTSLDNDVVISRAFVSDQEFLSSELPFYRNLRKEGIPL